MFLYWQDASPVWGSGGGSNPPPVFFVGFRDMHHIIALLRDSKGATAIEYGLIAALIAVAAITAVSNVGANVKKTFTNVASNIKAG